MNNYVIIRVRYHLPRTNFKISAVSHSLPTYRFLQLEKFLTLSGTLRVFIIGNSTFKRF